MAYIFETGGSQFLFHDACLKKTNYLTPTEKGMAEEYDAEAAAEARAEEYEAPELCDGCGAFLVKDQRPPESPLAQELRNLAIRYCDGQITDMLCALADIAEYHDSDTENLYRHSLRILREQKAPEHTLLGHMYHPHISAAMRAIRAIQEWAEKWDSRTILVLHKITEEEEEAHPHLFQTYEYADADHGGWDVYDMRGCYLDMYNDGGSVCECGRQITSYCAYDPDGTAEYGPCCFYIE